MRKRTPGYLKLHTQDAPEAASPAAPEVACAAEICRAFSAVTGWTLRYVAHAETDHDTDLLWSAPVDPGVGASPGHIRIDLGGSDPSAAGPLDLDQAQELAEPIADLLSNLFAARNALRRSEAELAAGVPVVVRSRDRAALAEQLEAVLKAGAEAVGGQSAALYMLDEATTELKLRASWGLPYDYLTRPARPLQGALADLEALLGHAVTLENDSLMDYWKTPHACQAAICVPISTAAVPLGTLWIFCDSAREFTDQQTNLVEVIAGRIAADLEKEMLLSAQAADQWPAPAGKAGRGLEGQIAAAGQLQRNQLPRIAPLIEGWEVAGWTCQAGQIGGSFHDWFVLASGSLAIAAGDALEGGLQAGMCVSGLRTALRAHADYPHEPEQLLARVNHTMWTASAGDQFASLFYGIIDQNTGSLRYSTAGRPTAWVLRAAKTQPLASATWPLGVQPEPNYEQHTERLDAGDMLLITSGFGESEISEAAVAALLPAQQLSADQLVELAQRQLLTAGQSAQQDRTILVVKRLSK